MALSERRELLGECLRAVAHTGLRQRVPPEVVIHKACHSITDLSKHGLKRLLVPFDLLLDLSNIVLWQAALFKHFGVGVALALHTRHDGLNVGPEGPLDERKAARIDVRAEINVPV